MVQVPYPKGDNCVLTTAITEDSGITFQAHKMFDEGCVALQIWKFSRFYYKGLFDS